MNSGVRKVFIAMLAFVFVTISFVYCGVSFAYYPYGNAFVNPVYRTYAQNVNNGYNNFNGCNCHCNNHFRHNNNFYSRNNMPVSPYVNNVNYVYTNGYKVDDPRFFAVPNYNLNRNQQNPYFRR